MTENIPSHTSYLQSISTVVTATVSDGVLPARGFTFDNNSFLSQSEHIFFIPVHTKTHTHSEKTSPVTHTHTRGKLICFSTNQKKRRRETTFPVEALCPVSLYCKDAHPTYLLRIVIAESPSKDGEVCAILCRFIHGG